jgi:hypothetical protein
LARLKGAGNDRDRISAKSDRLGRRLPPRRGLTTVISCTTGRAHVTLQAPANPPIWVDPTKDFVYRWRSILVVRMWDRVSCDFWIKGPIPWRSLGLVRRIVIASSTYSCPKWKPGAVGGVVGYHHVDVEAQDWRSCFSIGVPLPHFSRFLHSF